LVLVAGAAFLVVVAGFDAPWPFSVLMVASLGLALWLVWLRPVRISAPDLAALPATGVVAGGIGLAFALAYGQVPGRTPTSSVELIFAFLARGAQAAWPALDHARRGRPAADRPRGAVAAPAGERPPLDAPR